MNLEEFSKQMSKLQEFKLPSYVTEFQKIQEHINLQIHPTIKILDEFQKYYNPIELAFPPDFNIDIQKNFAGLSKIAEILKSSIPDLTAFDYNIEDFDKEEYNEKEVIQLVDNTKLLLTSIYTQNNLLDVVDPREFEKIIAELLQYKGYEVHLTKRTRDGGYDVLALTKIGGIPFKILAECKRHKKNIGIDIIRSFCDVVNYEKANKGIIFTTSYFSKPAIIRQSEMGTILDLKNRDDLIEWIIQYNER